MLDAGDLEVMTLSGDMEIITTGAKVRASSTYGSILKEAISHGVDEYELTTVTGDIHLRKTK